MALPIPELPPVTIATFPLSVIRLPPVSFVSIWKGQPALLPFLGIIEGRHQRADRPQRVVPIRAEWAVRWGPR